MKIKCEFCGNFINDTDEICPNCSAANEHLVRAGSDIPKSLEELIRFCSEKKLPLEKMRFFIGNDCKEAKAFGIFKDNDGNFVVYKNKSDGSRMIRYRGRDEAYAVNEIYQKLRNELVDRKESGKLLANTTAPNNIKASRQTAVSKSQRASRPVNRSAKRSRDDSFSKSDIKSLIISISVFIIVAVIFVSCASCISRIPDTGFYKYNGSDYYSDGSNWYKYDSDSNSWPVDKNYPSELNDNYGSYYYSDTFDSRQSGYSDSYNSSDIPGFWNSSDYSWDNSDSWDSSDDSWSSSDDSWNSSSSWDSSDDSWDSSWDDNDWDFDFSDWDFGDTDWDSDW